MTNVFILESEIEWEKSEVIGVFSSRKLATTAFKEYRLKLDTQTHAALITTRCVSKFESGVNSVLHSRGLYYNINEYTLDVIDM